MITPIVEQRWGEALRADNMAKWCAIRMWMAEEWRIGMGDDYLALSQLARQHQFDLQPSRGENRNSKDHKSAAEPPLDCRVRGWQPIETAPKDGVILVSNGDVVSIGWWYETGFTFWLAAEMPPTHWMPLPAAPTIPEGYVLVPEEMLDAVEQFVDRVERGEVRSKTTYAKFKNALAMIAAPKGETA